MITGFVQGQVLRLSAPVVAADTLDYLTAQFVFRSADWNGMEKWAHFAKGGTVYDIPLTDDKIRREDHLNLAAGEWKVYVHGNRFEGGKVVERITTAEDVLCVVPTGTLDGEPFPEMPASVTEQILARLAKVEQNGGGSGGGYSPEAKVERVEGGVRVTIVDKNGTTSEVVQDGKSGVHVGSDAPPAGTRVWVNPSGNRTKIPVIDDTLTKAGYAADAAAVGEALKKQSDAIADLADGIVETASGEVIAATDTVDAPIRGLVVYGKSTQDGTPTPDAPVPIVAAFENGGGVYVDRQYLPITTKLRGIPVPVGLGGNYTDADGQQWICDKIDFVRGVKVQRITDKQITDFTNLSICSDVWQRDGATAVYRGWSLNSIDSSNNRIMSDKFKTSGWEFSATKDINDVICARKNNIYFRVSNALTGVNADDDNTTKLQKIKTYMERIGGFYVEYPLVEPIEIPLSAEELAAYRDAALRTNYPNTTIYADDNAGLSVTYRADTKGYIDKKIAELAAAIVNA